MKFEFQCAHCDALITADRVQRGESSVCPECNKPIIVPLCDLRLGVDYAGFLLQKRLGSGTFGEVFKALHLDSGQIMALKVMPDGGGSADPEKATERFMNEVAMMARVTHPNVVPATKAGMYDGYFFLAMDFIDGVNLEELVETDGVMAEGEVLSLVIKVVGALEYAWESHKIIHRDIKPANVMVTPEGDVKLMDLGLSKSGYDGADVVQTETNMVGTPYYMSPEQVRGVEIDWRSDQYSLGATIFHLLTGRPPFEAETCAELMDVIMKEPTPVASQYGADISPGVDKLLNYMMAKDPEERYDTWGQVSQAVKRVLNGTLPQAPEKLSHMATADGIRRSRMRNAGRSKSKLGSSTVSGIPGDTLTESSPHSSPKSGESTGSQTAIRGTGTPKADSSPTAVDPAAEDAQALPPMPTPGKEVGRPNSWLIAAIIVLLVVIVVLVVLIAVL